jgi:hypothetical protein
MVFVPQINVTFAPILNKCTNISYYYLNTIKLYGNSAVLSHFSMLGFALSMYLLTQRPTWKRRHAYHCVKSVQPKVSKASNDRERQPSNDCEACVRRDCVDAAA